MIIYKVKVLAEAWSQLVVIDSSSSSHCIDSSTIN